MSIQAIGILVTVGLSLLSLGVTWMIYLLKRFIGKQDVLTEAMFYPTGPIASIRTDITGIHSQLPTFVKNDKLELVERRLGDALQTLRQEGNARESNILNAVDKASESNTKDNDNLRTEITGVNKRIDALYERRLSAQMSAQKS